MCFPVIDTFLVFIVKYDLNCKQFCLFFLHYLDFGKIYFIQLDFCQINVAFIQLLFNIHK